MLGKGSNPLSLPYLIFNVGTLQVMISQKSLKIHGNKHRKALVWGQPWFDVLSAQHSSAVLSADKGIGALMGRKGKTGELM